MSELEEKPPGRPETPEHEQREAELQRRIEALEKEKQLLEKQMELKDMVHQLRLEEAVQRHKATKRKGFKKKR